MLALRPLRLPSLSRRKALAYALSAAIFAFAVWAALRLSFPPDPFARKGHRPGQEPSPLQVQTERDTLTIHRGQETHTYRFRQTKDGIVAEEVPEEE